MPHTVRYRLANDGVNPHPVPSGWGFSLCRPLRRSLCRRLRYPVPWANEQGASLLTGTRIEGMAIEIPTNLTPELVPFAWLLGTWEGTGTMWYEGQENTPFGQIITFEQDGLPFIEYRAESFLLDDEGQKLRPITVETGFWQIDRPLTDADGGFGIVPKDVVPAFPDAESVETLRNEDDGFSLLATIAHPGGISENYVGMVKGPVIRMQTGNLLRDDISHDYAGSVRLWGLVNGNLMWDWEVADAEGKLHKHASAELRKTSSMTGDSLGTSMFGSLDGEEPTGEPGSEPTA